MLTEGSVPETPAPVFPPLEEDGVGVGRGEGDGTGEGDETGEGDGRGEGGGTAAGSQMSSIVVEAGAVWVAPSSPLPQAQPSTAPLATR